MKNLAFISGATSGIGRATAERLVKSGHGIIINGRRKDRLEEIQHRLKSFGFVEIAHFDVSNKDEIREWFKANRSLADEISILINNAGLAKGVDPVHQAKMEDWEQMIDVNIKGLLYLTKECLPSILRLKGHIVNVGSVAGRWAYPGGSVYCSTKFAVRALSESFRMDLSGTGVRITNIEPGMVETEFSEVRLGDPEAAKKVYEGFQPLNPEDIAETITWSLGRPAHVNIQEMVIFPTDQASIRDVYRALN